MSFNAVAQIFIYLLVLSAAAVLLGHYMAKVYSGGRGGLCRLFEPLERLIYRLTGVKPALEMNWRDYALSMMAFNFLGILAVYGLQRLQAYLPLNPQAFGAVSPDLAFNTALSFVSNTNWQAYSGESTMGYLTQMCGLGVQNFLSAATGMAILVALIRGFTRKSCITIGNFWVDTVRSIVYVLLPLSLLFSMVLVSQGVVQTFSSYIDVPFAEKQMTADGQEVVEQSIAVGPAASQIAIKQLGTNGGGFFNANSAHPFENPTPLSNFLEALAILLIPAALCHTFGVMIADRRQGWALYAAITAVLAVFLFIGVFFEEKGNPRLASLLVDQQPSEMQAGGNMEGKEVRFGPVNSGIWAVVTTAASNGAVNSMHDSFTPLGGLAPLLLMQFGEVIFGGVGSGLYGLIVFAMLAVFIAGLMVGRTPEYLGKKISAYEMKIVSFVVLLPCVLVLVCTAIALVVPEARASITNPQAHGLSQVLYAYSSMGNNNGSAFAGFGANIPLHNFLGGIAMFLSRFWIAIPILALAGSLAQKTTVPASSGTLPTHTPLFIALLIGVILIVGVLTFLPVLALGPIAEHLQLAGAL